MARTHYSMKRSAVLNRAQLYLGPEPMPRELVRDLSEYVRTCEWPPFEEAIFRIVQPYRKPYTGL